MDEMIQLNSGEAVLYEVTNDQPNLRTYIASTPETREICTRSEIFSPEFEYFLQKGIRKIITQTKLKDIILQNMNKLINADVLDILRGGSNFDPRSGLYRLGLRATRHVLSSQRKQNEDGSWTVTDDSYCKIFAEEVQPKREVHLFFGDIVATGKSLEAGLSKFLQRVKEKDYTLKSVFFFTIGGKQSEEILEKLLKDYEGVDIHVVYIEARFGIATWETPIKIKKEGTDLLVYWENALPSPEYVLELLKKPEFLLEKCAIYDGGKRANSWEAHLLEVKKYWEQLNESGNILFEAINERMPILNVKNTEELMNMFPGWKSIDCDLKAEIISSIDKIKKDFSDTNESFKKICSERIDMLQKIINGKQPDTGLPTS